METIYKVVKYYLARLLTNAMMGTNKTHVCRVSLLCTFNNFLLLFAGVTKYQHKPWTHYRDLTFV